MFYRKLCFGLISVYFKVTEIGKINIRLALFSRQMVFSPEFGNNSDKGTKFFCHVISMLWKLPSSESGNSLEIFEPQTKFSTWRFRVNFQDRFEQLGFWLYPMSNKTRNLENCLCLTLSWVISPSSWWHLFDHFNDHWDFRHSQPQGYRFWHYFTGCLGLSGGFTCFGASGCYHKQTFKFLCHVRIRKFQFLIEFDSSKWSSRL